MNIQLATDTKTRLYQYEVDLLLKTIGYTKALTTDSSTFAHFFPITKKEFPVKLRPAIKKLARSYKTTIMFNDKVADVAERMYSFRPF